MLEHHENIGFRIASFTVDPVPETDIEASLTALAEVYGPKRDIAAITPPPGEDALRAQIRRTAPRLAELGEQLRAQLESDCTGVAIPSLGLAHLDINSRAHVLYALSLCLGHPTATDKLSRQVVWDIKVRAEKWRDGAVSTFSEHPDEADFHTDTQYAPAPERYLLLYCIKPADCGGGQSFFRDIECIRTALSQSEEGRWAWDYLLHREVPYRIPAVFTDTGERDRVELTFARVLGQRPQVRYRSDTLMAGLAAFPEGDSPELRRALAIFKAELDAPARKVSLTLPADGCFLVNNHNALHGRTPFSDHSRHLWRIRIADQMPLDATRSRTLH